jgi:hypothetical protein
MTEEHSCLHCVLKHLAKARALLIEAAVSSEYRRHRIYAMGEMACAEEESIADAPEVSAAIRALRLDIDRGGGCVIPSFDEILDLIEKVEIPDA